MLQKKILLERAFLFFCILAVSFTSLQCRKYRAYKGNTPGSKWKKTMPGEWKIANLTVDGKEWVPYFDSVFGGPGTLTIEKEQTIVQDYHSGDRKSDFRFYFEWNEILISNYLVDLEGDEYPNFIWVQQIPQFDYVQNYDKDTDDVLFNSFVINVNDFYCMFDSDTFILYTRGNYLHHTNPYMYNAGNIIFSGHKTIFIYLIKN